MEQKLIAFWKYDTIPYILSGEIESFTTEGNVRIKGYNGMIFKPIKIIPYEEGVKIKKKIDEIGRESRKREREIYIDCINSVKSLIGDCF